MNKFWDWIEENGYGFLADEHGENCLTDGEGVIEYPTKQMLIGYMMQYIYLKNTVIRDINDFDNIKDVYNHLEETIENCNITQE